MANDIVVDSEDWSEVQKQLDELQDELDNEEITQKGFEKKKKKILENYYRRSKSSWVPPPIEVPETVVAHSGDDGDDVTFKIEEDNDEDEDNDEYVVTRSVAYPHSLPPTANSIRKESTSSDSRAPSPVARTTGSPTPRTSVANGDDSPDYPSLRIMPPPPAGGMRSVSNIPPDVPDGSHPPSTSHSQSVGDEFDPPFIHRTPGSNATDVILTQLGSQQPPIDPSNPRMQKLLSTLRRPKVRELEDYYTDGDDDVLSPQLSEPPFRPEGKMMLPQHGPNISVSHDLDVPDSVEGAMHFFGSHYPKSPCLSLIDGSGKVREVLSYGKLRDKAEKIASYLVCPKGKMEPLVKPGDRVALVYPNSDPHHFICAFYGCYVAGVIPVPIEVPITKKDVGSTQTGFLLGNCSVSVALTTSTCLKNFPKNYAGEIVNFSGWPRLTWIPTDQIKKIHSKSWRERCGLINEAYIEYCTSRTGSVMGVTLTKTAVNSHCEVLRYCCTYKQDDIMVCVPDFRRDVGLWHGILTTVYVGMHVVFIPYALMKNNPASWMVMISKFKASAAVVKSRDMHWGMVAASNLKDINLASLKLLLVTDGANPWSVTTCDTFSTTFQSKNFKPEALCPCATSSEALTVSIRRLSRHGSDNNPSPGRGSLSMQALSYNVVKVEADDHLSALQLQDAGSILPSSSIVVVKIEGPPYLCKRDEVGEICVASQATGFNYWGLQGLSNNIFKVFPMDSNGQVVCQQTYTRTGLFGFLGPNGLVFVVGRAEGMMKIDGRIFIADDIIATALAVDPIKFVYRGRIAVFSVEVLREQRIVVVAEQRPEVPEDECFKWMFKVLPAVETIHSTNIYCLALVQPNGLPKTQVGGIHLVETKERFLNGALNPTYVQMCPHACIANLPRPRTSRVDDFVGPGSVLVGQLVNDGRPFPPQDLNISPVGSGVLEQDSASIFVAEMLRRRAVRHPENVLFTQLNSKMNCVQRATCSSLHKKAEKIAALLHEKVKARVGIHVALIYPPGIDLIAAFYGCLYLGCIPIAVRPPHPYNIPETLPTVRMAVEASQAAVILTNNFIMKILKSKQLATQESKRSQRKESNPVNSLKSWPPIVDTDESPKRRTPTAYTPKSPDETVYLDFSVSTMGMLTGVEMTHSRVASLCRSQKIACELYHLRRILLCLDPYSGLGFVLWCLLGVYCGHESVLIAPSELEINPAVWLCAASHEKIRDIYCSYNAIELSHKSLGAQTQLLKDRGVNLSCIRTCVIVAEERPRIKLLHQFCSVFRSLGLQSRAVSTSFGCRVNPAICVQGAFTPEPTSVYVCLKALRNDRIELVGRGSPHSIKLVESGKVLPGVKVVIANIENCSQCPDSRLGEIWVNCNHNAKGYYAPMEQDIMQQSTFDSRLTSGDTQTSYARTGYLGFIRKTELTQADGERHDALFVVGSLEEAMTLRAMRYFPVDIENTVLRSHKRVTECAVFTWTDLLVVVVEIQGEYTEALDVIPQIVNYILNEHFLIVGAVVIVDPGVIPINCRGEKQRMHLRDKFLSDDLDPIYVSYMH